MAIERRPIACITSCLGACAVLSADGALGDNVCGRGARAGARDFRTRLKSIVAGTPTWLAGRQVREAPCRELEARQDVQVCSFIQVIFQIRPAVAIDVLPGIETSWIAAMSGFPLVRHGVAVRIRRDRP